MHHLEGLAVTERCEIGAPRCLFACLRGRPHDHHDFVARASDVDQLGLAPTTPRIGHELERLLAVLARAGRRGVAAMSLDVRVKELAKPIEIAPGAASKPRRAGSTFVSVMAAMLAPLRATMVRI